MGQSLRNVWWLVTLLCALQSCGAPESPGSDPSGLAAGGQASDEDGGYETYMIRCAACHGETADGTSVAPPLRYPTMGYATWVIRNGRDGTAMPPFSELVVDSEELREIFDWLRGSEKPEGGGALYALYCGHCHGRHADGGMAEKSLRDVLGRPDLIYSYIRDGAGGDGYQDRLGYMPAWSESELADIEIDKIIEYLEAL